MIFFVFLQKNHCCVHYVRDYTHVEAVTPFCHINTQYISAKYLYNEIKRLWRIRGKKSQVSFPYLVSVAVLLKLLIFSL